MKPGTVFRWKEFPYRKSGELKARWLIYLGKTPLFSTPVLAHLCTSTTHIEAFKTGGSRREHDHIILIPKRHPVEEECILDLDEKPHSVPEEKLLNNPNIEIKGELTEQDLRTIYNKLRKSNAYSKAIILDIHRCFNEIGITSLKMPK